MNYNFDGCESISKSVSFATTHKNRLYIRDRFKALATKRIETAIPIGLRANRICLIIFSNYLLIIFLIQFNSTFTIPFTNMHVFTQFVYTEILISIY